MAKKSVLKTIKQALGTSENAFFRLFLPLSLVIPFVGDYGHYFFLTLTSIDLARCIWYIKDSSKQYDTPNQQIWNFVFYGLKALVNVMASIFIILAMEYPNGFGKLDASLLMVLGQILFIGGVVLSTAFRSLYKALRPDPPPQDTDVPEHLKKIKNGIVALTLFGVGTGLGLLFFTDQMLGAYPLGWTVLLISNIFPVTGFAFLHRSPYLFVASALLIVGAATLFGAPDLSQVLDMGLNAGVAMKLILSGFLLSIITEAYSIAKPAKSDKSTRTFTVVTESSVMTRHPSSNPTNAANTLFSRLSCCFSWSNQLTPQQSMKKERDQSLGYPQN